jgi:hypothetical protein
VTLRDGDQPFLRRGPAARCPIRDTGSGVPVKSGLRKRESQTMGKVVAGATVSLDGFIADESDRVGPLFD